MILDIIIFIIYIALVLGVGLYFFRKNKSEDDYYLGGRSISSWHIGLSVVATDVGGGFSIGLSGLGFTIGLSGSWMLFTGLIGAWMAAVFLIPKLFRIPQFKNFLTLPQLFKHFYTAPVALIAGIIVTIGYLFFTSAQVVAGAKLASGTFPELNYYGAVAIMGVAALTYTILGGLKAVVYTDTVQWIILICGLLFLGVPFAYMEVGGLEAIKETVGGEMLSLNNVGWIELFNWGITIIPIWFVGMTLYQRIFASRDEASAKKAWFIAGLFEWPVMAFLGVTLGLLARVALEQGLFTDMGYLPGGEMDEELGLPVLLRSILPHGLMGIVLAAYFSAVMSTADSCLMAASASLTNDILPRKKQGFWSKHMRVSQLGTAFLGIIALGFAFIMKSVLNIMLFSYAFMVSGLLVPVIGALFWKRSSPAGALAAIVGGGTLTSVMTLMEIKPWGIDPNIFGLLLSFILFITISLLVPSNYAHNDDRKKQHYL